MMFVCLLFSCFCLLTEAISNAVQCWEKKDVRLNKDGFIRCRKSMIIVKDIRIDEDIGNGIWKNTCRSVNMDSYMKKLMKCNGLNEVCGVNEVDILAVLKEYIGNCDWSIYYGYSSDTLRGCIIYDCIHGQMNKLVHSTTITKARGSLYQAVQFKGFLRCAINGHITNITVIRSNFLKLSVRDEHGGEVLQFVGNSGMYYKCRNTTFGLDGNHQAENETATDEVYNYSQNAMFGLESNHQTENRTEKARDKFQVYSVHTFPWILASISMTLSLVSTIICVTLSLRRKNKGVTEESPEIENIQSDLLHENQGQSSFESELYMENRF